MPAASAGAGAAASSSNFYFGAHVGGSAAAAIVNVRGTPLVTHHPLPKGWRETAARRPGP